MRGGKEEGSSLRWGENSPNVRTISPTGGVCDKYRQHKKKAEGRYSSTLTHREGEGGAGYDSLVLMREDRGLPEPSVNDGGTAELGGLKSTRERQLGIPLRWGVWRITYFIQPVQHLDSGLPVDTRVGDTDTILES